MVADERHAPDADGELAEGGLGEHFLDVLRVVTERRARRQVPQREHRVRLAAAKVRLQVDDRRGVLVARQTPHGTLDQIAQALGQVGAREELDRLGVVLAGVLGGGDLVEVGGELGRLEVASGDIIMGGKDLAPRAQPGRLRRHGRRLQDLPVVLIGGQATQAQADRLDVIGNGRRADSDEQPFGGVEAAVGIVVAEGLVVSPVVPGLPQLLAVPLPDPADRVVKGIPARLQVVRDVLGEHPQLDLRVEVVVLLPRRPLLPSSTVPGVFRRVERLILACLLGLSARTGWVS